MAEFIRPAFALELLTARRGSSTGSRFELVSAPLARCSHTRRPAVYAHRSGESAKRTLNNGAFVYAENRRGVYAQDVSMSFRSCGWERVLGSQRSGSIQKWVAGYGVEAAYA